MSQISKEESPLRILFIWGSMNIGGAQTAGLDLAKSLKKRDHHVAYLSEGGSLVPELRACGIPHYQARVDTKNPLRMVRASYVVEKICRREKINSLYCDNLAQTAMAYLARRRLKRHKWKLSIVTVMHGHQRPIYYHISSPLYNLITDHVIAVCDFERKRIINHGLKADQVSTIYNALSLSDLPYPAPHPNKLYDELALSPEIPLLGFLGRLSPEKDLPTLLRAVAFALEKSPDFHFVVIGDGAERKDLEELARSLKIERKVHFLGYRRDIPDLLSSLSVLALSSTRELFPMVVLEAFYYRCPVVATAIGGVPEMVRSGETGYTVQPGRPKELAEKICLLIEDGQKREEMGQRGREMVLERFGLERATDELEKAFRGEYEKILSR